MAFQRAAGNFFPVPLYREQNFELEIQLDKRIIKYNIAKLIFSVFNMFTG